MKATKWYTILVLTLMLVVGPAQRMMAAPAQQSGPTTWTVRVGAEAEGGQWQLAKFYPHTLTINEGDTVVFKHTAADPHNVIFFTTPPKTNYGPLGTEASFYPGGSQQKFVLNPKAYYPFGGNTFDGSADVGSGILGKGGATDGRNVEEFHLTFPKAGSYNFACSLHVRRDPKTGQISGMIGSITVQAAGSAYPKTQAQIDSDASAEIAADSQQAMSHDAEVKKVDTVKQANGTTLYKVGIGGMVKFDNGSAEYVGYSAPSLTIKQGDTVEWSNPQGGLETVTFAPNGKMPPYFTKQPLAGQPDELVINIDAFMKSSGHSYDGNGDFNSGAIANLGPNAPPFPQSYDITFTKPGTYQYASVVDGDYGMKGSITVTANNAMPMMPQTGSSSADGFGWLLVLAVGLLAAGLLLKRRIVALAD